MVIEAPSFPFYWVRDIRVADTVKTAVTEINAKLSIYVPWLQMP
jgi:hypothetical protein